MKLAFITPRYGADITAGAEHACRLLAEQVCERHDVDVLTTCASDPSTWANQTAEGADRMRGVVVRRFAVSQPHDADEFQRLTQRLADGPRSHPEELEWVRRLGPWSPGLLDHLKRLHKSYDALVFFSLLHPTTVHGLPIAPERSILFPFLSLQPALRFALWPEVVSWPRAVGLFANSERRLLHSYVRAQPQYEELVGIGIEPLPQQSYPRPQQDPADNPPPEGEEIADDEPAEIGYLESRGVPFRRRNRLYGRFAVYSGRIEPDNGSEEMLEYFDSFAAGSDAAVPRTPLRAAEPSDLSLVLTGVKMMKLPEESYVRLAGVLPERDRMIAFEAADLTISPAADDLLAQPLLESFAVGTPVIASAANDTAVEHCRRANAGLYYASREEFVEAMRVLTGNERLRERLGENGRAYIKQHFRWDAVLARFDRLLARVRSR